MNIYKTSEFAKKIGVCTRTLQRWDRSGVLKANRTPTNRRYYTEEQLQTYYAYNWDVINYKYELGAKCPTHKVFKNPEFGCIFWKPLWNGYNIEVYGIERSTQRATIRVWENKTLVETISGISHDQLPEIWQDVENDTKERGDNKTWMKSIHLKMG